MRGTTALKAMLPPAARGAARRVRDDFKDGPVWRALRPKRRFQIYSLGTTKSGASTLKRCFRPHYRVGDEPEHQRVIAAILAFAEGKIDRAELAAFARAHDSRTWLELHASQLNYFLMEALLESFAEAKFILTIRDCYSWADAFMHQQLTLPLPLDSPWHKFRDLRFGADRFAHAAEERLLAARGLYTLDGYFSYWAEHNTRVISLIPKDRLLVVRTEEIGDALGRLSRFAGIEPGRLSPGPAYGDVARPVHGFLTALDDNFVEDKAQHHCGPLMQTYFPDVLGPWASRPTAEEPAAPPRQAEEALPEAPRKAVRK